MRLRVRTLQKNMLLKFVLVIAAITGFAGASFAQAEPGQLRYVPNEYIIHVRAGTSLTDVKAMVDRLGATVVTALPVSDSYWIRMGRSGEATRSISGASRLSAVKWTIDKIQPNYLKRLSYIPDDSWWSSLWGMRMINAPTAWDIERGNSGIVVAVIDSGVAPHPDLINRLLPGKDFVEPANLDGQYDPVGHGTHVSGTIAAQGDNGMGVTGVCMDGVKILPLRAADAKGELTSATEVAALQYALNSGVNVVNMSFGGYYNDDIERSAIRSLYDAGVILVAAAGNDSSNIPHYPSGWPEVISVSAIGPREGIAWYSNYGKIDIAAPGGDSDTYGIEGGILSTGVQYTAPPAAGGTPQAVYNYETMDGTSMACPHVAGAAALLLSSGLTPVETTERLLTSARAPLYSVNDPSMYGAGILDLKGAFTGGDVKIVKPAKGSTGLDNSDFKISLTTIDTMTVKVYMDYTDSDDNGVPDNLNDSTYVVIDGLNPTQQSYFSLDGKTLAFKWPLPGHTRFAEGNHKVYVTGNSTTNGTTYSDWASFHVSTQVIKAGVHLFAFPYWRSPLGEEGSIPMTTLPSDLLLEVGTGAKVKFLSSGTNRAVLMRWLPESPIVRSVPYFSYTEDKLPAAKSIAERLAWDNPLYTGGGFSTGDTDTAKFPAGAGFWLYLPKDVQIDRSYTFMPVDDAFSIYLYSGWNMIGNPFPREVAWQSSLFSYRGDGPKTLMEAEMAGWVKSNLFEWDTVYGRYVNITARDMLKPFNGYWLRSNVGSSAPGDQLIVTVMP